MRLKEKVDIKKKKEFKDTHTHTHTHTHCSFLSHPSLSQSVFAFLSVSVFAPPSLVTVCRRLNIGVVRIPQTIELQS